MDTNRDWIHPVYKHRLQQLNAVLDYCDFSDVFRVLHPEDQWYSFVEKLYGSRLDYTFVSLDLLNRVRESEIGVAYVSDHAPIYATIDNGHNPSGRNYWKFPNYLIHCNEYKDMLRLEIPLIVARNKNSVSFAILWDIVKQQFRQITMRYVKNKLECKKEWIEELESRIAQMYSQLPLLDGLQFENVKKQIVEVNAHILVIHKADWKEYYIGRMQQCKEHSSKVFFSRISSNPGSIANLKNQNNEMVSDDQSILNVCTDFLKIFFAINRYNRLMMQSQKILLIVQDVMNQTCCMHSSQTNLRSD